MVLISFFPLFDTFLLSWRLSLSTSTGWPSSTTLRTCTSTAYGDSGDIDLALDNYTYGPDKSIFVPDFLMKTWERSDPPVMILYNTLHSKQAKR